MYVVVFFCEEIQQEVNFKASVKTKLFTEMQENNSVLIRTENSYKF